VLALERLAEQRIGEAVARGELDGLPGAGRPLELDDDRFVPEELRVAYRILKNAGCLPPELATRGELVRLAGLLECAVGEGERRAIATRMALLRARIGEERATTLWTGSYGTQVAERLAGDWRRGSVSEAG